LNSIAFVFCIHNHQPVGNLPEVFRSACHDAYVPFLEEIERHPGIRIVLHNSGPLLEWYEENEPEYIERVAALAARGQAEILSGAFYEPIIATVPERDAVGQIQRMSEYVERTFGVRPRGAWLAERVWEPHLARVLATAGVEYVLLDDYEFRLSGVPEEELTGYYVTEDQGRPLRVVPILKRLRYSIPFREPEATVATLRSLAERGPGLCAVFGDDGEKFGVWPGTHEHVYTGGWLRRFFEAIEDEKDWVRVTTLSEYVDAEPPRGRVYLPASSYPEMMEWALPTPARRRYARLLKEIAERPDAADWRPFLAGGTWRSFLAKYDESNMMVRKMFRVSDRVAQDERAVEQISGAEELEGPGWPRRSGPDPVVDPRAVSSARTELWKGQCNCAYWHGIFGGLYLPHLRSAIYEHLIRAENLLDASREGRWASIDVRDHDLDGNDEVLLESDRLNAFVAPARGGAIFELDARAACWNICATMARHEEAYHEELARAQTGAAPSLTSIHDGIRAKDSGLERLVVPDCFPRWCAIDHVLAPGTTHAELATGCAKEISDLPGGRYAFEPARRDGAVGVVMRRETAVGGGSASIEKSIWLLDAGAVRVDYTVLATAPVRAVFASEWNIAFLTDHGEYVYFEHPAAGRLAAGERRTLDVSKGLTATDLLRNQRLALELDPPSSLWIDPLETASQSEGGLERVFQGTTVLAVVPLDLQAGKSARLSVTLRLREPEDS
jgi:hypothetical protein